MYFILNTKNENNISEFVVSIFLFDADKCFPAVGKHYKVAGKAFQVCRKGNNAWGKLYKNGRKGNNVWGKLYKFSGKGIYHVGKPFF